MKKVLITGMSGLIGGILRSHLDSLGRYELSALNRRSLEGVNCFQADIANLDAMRLAFEGQEVVVHLAAGPSDDPWDRVLTSYIIGTYNVFEAARLAGVKRVVFASSLSTTQGFQRVPPYDAIVAGRYAEAPRNFPKITHEMVWPRGLNGSAKVWGEAVGRHFSNAYGLSVLCVRIGIVKPDDRPLREIDYCYYLSHRDLVEIFQRSIEASGDLSYDIFPATSNNEWGILDLDHTRDVLGYDPRDSADVFI